ncbi:MAG: MFS transporter [Halanaerobium sp.]|nr:MFS transporter [Halanaerobium sp.]
MTGLQKFLYATGNGGATVLERIIVAWVVYLYLPPDQQPLITPALVGAIVFGGRIVDSIADPLFSYWTDTTSTRWGRRIPFMFVSGLPMVAMAVLIFSPPTELLSNLNAIWLLVTMGLFFIFFTSYLVAYLALLPELVRTTKARVQLSSLQAFFNILGAAIALIFSGILIDMFGFQMMALILGGVSLILLYLPLLGIDEKKMCKGKPMTFKLITSFKMAVQNTHFIYYQLANLSFWFGFNIITISTSYYVTVLMGLSEAYVSIFMAITFGVAILSFPVINKLAVTYGKKKAFSLCLLLNTIFLPLIYFIPGTWGPLTPFIKGIILMALPGFPLAGLFVLPNAIVADITDIDEGITGQRREATFFGVQGFFQKIILGLSTMVATGLFNNLGYSVSKPLGVQITGPIAGIFSLLGLLIFLKYPQETSDTSKDESRV